MEKLKNHKITNKKLRDQALTHKSWKKNSTHNERLEFLGDSVLNFIIADLLMRAYPQATEGDLTKKRSYLVSGSTLAKIAIEFDFPNYLRAGNKLYKKNHRILAGTLEAYIGALYLERGFSSVKKMIQHIFQDLLNQNFPELNYKAVLQEWCQKKYKEIPVYKLKKEAGQEHEKLFFIDVFIQSKICGSGSSRQKKPAEQAAAKKALKKLKVSFD